jgi:hypothetical protein
VVIDKLTANPGRYVTISMAASALYIDEIAVFAEGGEVAQEKPVIYASPDITPFYPLHTIYTAREFLCPATLINTHEQGYDLEITLPDGVTLVAPVHEKSGEGRIRVRDARLLFFKSTLPAGTRLPLEFKEQKTGRTQLLTLETISVPQVKPFRKLLASVTFASYLSFYHFWPDLVKNYRATGLNLLVPFASTDYHYMMLKKRDSRAYDLISEAKAAGLKVGGNASPYCNIQINATGLTRPAVYLDSNRQAKVNCPRLYDPANDLAELVKGAEAGLEYLFLDSEPYWSGSICACDVCEKKFANFLTVRNKVSHTLRETFISGGDSGKQLIQEFWDEFYINLWGHFHNAMPDVKLSLYGTPCTQEQGQFGNKARFTPLYRAEIIAWGAAEYYLTPTAEYGEKLRAAAKNMDGAPGIVWMTCGGGKMTYERSHADLRNRLYLVLINSFKGFCFWSARGVDAAEYGVISDVIGKLEPYEEWILTGKVSENETKADNSAKATLLESPAGALLLVECHADTIRKISVDLPDSYQTLTGVSHPGEKVDYAGGVLKLHLGGAESTRIRVFALKK